MLSACERLKIQLQNHPNSNLKFCSYKIVDQRKLVYLNCSLHGDFVRHSRHVFKGTDCSKCIVDKIRRRFIEEALKLHNGKYDYSKVKWINSYSKVEVICPDHGSWLVVPNTHIYRKSGCPGCFNDRNRLSIDQFLHRAKIIHGNRYDYSKVSFKTGHDRAKIRCNVHGLFLQEVRVHLAGCGCPKCFLVENRLGIEDFIINAKNIHGNQYDYSKVVYSNSKTKVEVICPDHGSFWLTPNSHISSRQGCRKCKESKGERRIRLFLEYHEIPYIKEYKILNNLYRYDFYIPSLNLLLEFQGQQHFFPVNRFEGQEMYDLQVIRDKVKVDLAVQNNFKFLAISYKKLKKSRLERYLERDFRYRGHIFDETKTLTRQ